MPGPAVASSLVLLLAAPVSVAAGAPGAQPARAAPRLDVRLELDPAAVERLDMVPSRARDPAAPECVAEFCPPRVELPGVVTPQVRASKTELFVALLDRARLEPAASIAWFFVATGLRVDWTPASVDQTYGAAHGWGNLFLRLRFRIDAWNRPAVPVRPRDRLPGLAEVTAPRA
jgi:hypothetical protein